MRFGPGEQGKLMPKEEVFEKESAAISEEPGRQRYQEIEGSHRFSFGHRRFEFYRSTGQFSHTVKCRGVSQSIEMPGVIPQDLALHSFRQVWPTLQLGRVVWLSVIVRDIGSVDHLILA